MKKTYFRTLKAGVLLLIIAMAQPAKAQFNPMGALYFQNQYLANPAMAGVDKGLNLNLGFRKQWTNIPGSPSMQTLTADYTLADKTSFGLNFYTDKAGLFRQTRTVASYAYHLIFHEAGAFDDGTEQLSFGLSLGFMNERISNEDLHGDPNDTYIDGYNQRSNYIDGDFGIAYTSNGLSIQAALPNLKSLFKKDLITSSIDRSIFFSAASYQFKFNEDITSFGFEPKVVFRGVQGFDNILDVGANLSYAENKVSVFGMYHNSKSTTFGVGVNHQLISISGIYSTATSALSNYTNGNFEISIKLKLAE